LLVIRNETDYPEAEVERLVRFAFAELELPSPYSIVARVSYTKPTKSRRRGAASMYGASGLARAHVRLRWDVPRNAAWEVLLRIGRPGDFPVAWFDRHYQHPVGILRNWQDALVAISAHEGKHIENYQLRLSSKLTTRAEEARCDAYAAARLRAWKEKDR
jgi:hypothetical protein